MCVCVCQTNKTDPANAYTSVRDNFLGVALSVAWGKLLFIVRRIGINTPNDHPPYLLAIWMEEIHILIRAEVMA